MTALTHPPSHPASAHATTPFVAADVGGTHVRIGLVAEHARGIDVLEYRKFACADFPGLAEVIASFLAELPAPRPAIRKGVIACAGHAMPDGTLLAANLPWPVSPAQIRERLGFSDFRVVNDFEAVAYAVGRAGAQTLLHLSGPDRAPAGPALVVGPGTGLGAAVRIPTARGNVVLATEAGQAALTTGNDLEMAVLREFLKARSHVPIEHALSGPGLVRLHHALAAIRGASATHDTPGAISAAAASGEDPLARETLEVFCGLLGSAIGDMALLYGAHGGVFLAGGVLPQIRDFLLQSSFVERFLDKGPMREALERIPVTLVEHGQLGVIGAASWYLDLEQTETSERMPAR